MIFATRFVVLLVPFALAACAGVSRAPGDTVMSPPQPPILVPQPQAEPSPGLVTDVPRVF